MSGNPLIKEKMELDVAVTKLKVSKANHTSQQYTLEDIVRKHFPERIAKTKQCIEGLEKDLAHFRAQPVAEEGISPMTVSGKTFTDKEEAGKAILTACKQIRTDEDMKLGKYRGFDMTLSFDSFMLEFHLNLQREMTQTVVLGTSETGNIVRIENALEGIEKKLQKSINELERLNSQLETAKKELGKPFPQEQELNEKIERLSKLNAILNINGNSVENEDIAADKTQDKELSPEDKDDGPADNDRKPSILDKIKNIKTEQNSKDTPKYPKKDKNTEID